MKTSSSSLSLATLVALALVASACPSSSPDCDPSACPPPQPCREAGACDPDTARCVYPLLQDGAACDDGNPCTTVDTCQAGACAGAEPLVCVAQDGCHYAGTCDPASGACGNPVKADGAPCSDGTACTLGDTCHVGVCVPGVPVTCADLDPCHPGVCDPLSGACSNPERTCVAIDQCREAGVCDPATGGCTSPPRPDGVACDDGSVCTRVDVCLAGACVGGEPLVCAALDQCHEPGTCDPVLGCSSPAKPDGAPCDDGDACRGPDTCVAGACLAGGPICSDAFGSTGSMATARIDHVAALLPDGQVLVAAGVTGGLGTSGVTNVLSAERYDPTGRAFAGAGALSTGGAGLAVTLADGRLLKVFAGGAVLRHPDTGDLTALAAPPLPSAAETATLLLDGTVLLTAADRAVLLDPATATYAATGGLAVTRHHPTATRLLDGKVLVAAGGRRTCTVSAVTKRWYCMAGYPASFEIYDPASGTFAPPGPLLEGRAGHTATLLPGGQVLLAGGERFRCPILPSSTNCTGGRLSTAEVYDPATGVTRATGGLSTARAGHTATLLLDGSVLLAGSAPESCLPRACSSAALASAERYVPATGRFQSAATMVTARGRHTATLLPDGMVLVAGGTTRCTAVACPPTLVCSSAPCTATAAAELYRP